MKQNFFVYYVILAVTQMIICNFLHLGPYVVLSILPVMVLCIPTRFSTLAAMCIAFMTGLFVDLLAEGTLGINVFALVPVAYARRFVCDSIFGAELVARGEDFSAKKYGLPKIAFAIILMQGLFLIFYLWADGASLRPIGFNLIRFAASLAAGVAVAVPLSTLLTPDDRR